MTFTSIPTTTTSATNARTSTPPTRSRPSMPFMAVLMTGLVAVAAAMALRAAAPPTTIAVIDLEVVYDKLDQHHASEKKLEAMVDELRGELQKREQELKMLQIELDTGYEKQSQGYLEMQGKVEAAVGKLMAFQEFAKLKTERESERLLKETYDRIKAACAGIAQAQGIHLVLLDDATPTFAAADPRPMMQQISARRSLYVDPSLDLTQLVIDRMNQEFAARQGSASPSP